MEQIPAADRLSDITTITYYSWLIVWQGSSMKTIFTAGCSSGFRVLTPNTKINFFFYFRGATSYICHVFLKRFNVIPLITLATRWKHYNSLSQLPQYLRLSHMHHLTY